MVGTISYPEHIFANALFSLLISIVTWPLVFLSLNRFILRY